mgnify:FL=1
MEIDNLTQHTSRQYNDELENLKNSVMNMGGIVEAQLTSALKSFSDADSELGLKVAKDDHKINLLEVEIDQECSRILATRSPAAIDLRIIIGIIKAITDLERIGDEADKIGSISARLASHQRPDSNYKEHRNLANLVKTMLRDCLDCFARLDADKALDIYKSDEEVDYEYEVICRHSITIMMEDPKMISRIIDLTWVARSLERIGDHVKNICEYIIFIVHGKDIRHTDINKIILPEDL